MSQSQNNFRAQDMLGVPKPTPVAKPSVAKPAHSKSAKEAKKEVIVEPVAPVVVEEPAAVVEVVEEAPVEE